MLDQLFFGAPRQPLRRAGFRVRGCALIRIHIGMGAPSADHPGRLWLFLVLWVGNCATRPAPRSVEHLRALCGHGVRWVDAPHPVPPVVACGASGGAVSS